MPVPLLLIVEVNVGVGVGGGVIVSVRDMVCDAVDNTVADGVDVKL